MFKTFFNKVQHDFASGGKVIDPAYAFSTLFCQLQKIVKWKAFKNQKKEIDTKNAKNGSFLEVSERKFSSVPFRF